MTAIRKIITARLPYYVRKGPVLTDLTDKVNLGLKQNQQKFGAIIDKSNATNAYQWVTASPFSKRFNLEHISLRIGKLSR